jgi:hypothetical protein
MQVVAITLKDVVLLQADFDEQVARWATIGARLTITRATDAHAVVDACWNFDFQCFLFFDFALTMASGAGVWNDLA